MPAPSLSLSLILRSAVMFALFTPSLRQRHIAARCGDGATARPAIKNGTEALTTWSEERRSQGARSEVVK